VCMPEAALMIWASPHCPKSSSGSDGQSVSGGTGSSSLLVSLLTPLMWCLLDEQEKEEAETEEEEEAEPEVEEDEEEEVYGEEVDREAEAEGCDDNK
jgi:hypothetical protein